MGRQLQRLTLLSGSREEELFLNSLEDNIHSQRPGISCKSKCSLAPVPFVGAGVVEDELSFKASTNQIPQQHFPSALDITSSLTLVL